MQQLADLYADFVTVLRTAPHGDAVLSSLLLPANSLDVPVADVLGTPCEESIDGKLARGDYNLPPPEFPDNGGPTLFFHDMKLAFGRLVGQYPQDSVEYHEITQLFKFAIDLLVREASRLKFNRTPPSDEDEHLMRISQGFETISAEIQDWNSETFWVTAANGPLFMSAPKKAPVDPRDTVVAGSVHTVKLLPYSARAPESTLGVVSPLNPRIPQPEVPPTDLLSGFRHPNGSTIVPPLWITGQDGYSSFAPTLDSNNAVVPTEDAAAVWMEKAKPVPGLDTKVSSKTDEKADTNTDTNIGPKEENDKVDYGLNNGENGDVSMNDAGFDLAGDLVGDLGGYDADLDGQDLELLLRWTPYSFVDDDELEAARNNTERELASKLLLELQHMQHTRLSQPNADDIPEAERHVALKVANVLARLVETADSADTKLKLDPRLPVLMRNYAGSLPAATDPALHSQPGFQPQRLQTIANMRNRRPQRR